MTVKTGKLLLSGLWNKEGVGMGEPGSVMPATLGTDTQRLARLVARLRLHLFVMLLIFEIDMLFHLLIFF